MNVELLKKYTNLVIRRGNEWLVGKILCCDDVRWSTSPYDAWTTKDLNLARKVAVKYGGDVWMFNNIVGEWRIYGWQRMGGIRESHGEGGNLSDYDSQSDGKSGDVERIGA